MMPEYVKKISFTISFSLASISLKQLRLPAERG
jgi:hypothetical protein